MEMLSIEEEHNISLVLNDAPKNNYEKSLPTSKKLERNCVYLTHPDLFTVHYSHMSPLDDAVHNVFHIQK